MRRWLVGGAVVVTLLLLAAAGRIAVSYFAVPASAPPWVADGTDAHGDPLPEGALARLGTLRFRTTTFTNVAWLDDGRIASGGFQDEIVIFDPETGERLQVLEGHKGVVPVPPRRWTWRDARRAIVEGETPARDDYLRGGHLEQVGDRLISAGAAVRSWDLATGEGRLLTMPRGGNVSSFLVVQDGAAIRFTIGDREHLVDLATGRDKRTKLRRSAPDSWEIAEAPVACMTAQHDSKGKILIRDDVSGATRVLAELPKDTILGSACFSLDGTELYCVYTPRKDGRIGGPARLVVHDTESGENLRSVELGDGVAWWFVAISPDGRRVATSSVQGVVALRDAQTLAVLRAFDPVPAGVYATEFSPDGSRLALRVGQMTISIADVATGERTRVPDAHEAPVQRIVFPDDARVVTTAWDGVLRCWEARTGRPLWERATDRIVVAAATLGGGALRVARERSIDVLDTDDGETTSSHELPEDWRVHAVAPDGTAFMESDSALALLAPDDAEPRAFLDRGIAPRAQEGTRTDPIAWDPPGERVLVQDTVRTPSGESGWSGKITPRLVDTRDGHTLWTYPKHASFETAAFAPGLTAVAEHNAIVVLGDDGTQVAPIEADLRFGPTALALSVDGARVAAADHDLVVRVWSVATHALLHELRGHGGQVTCLTFSPDGSLLASGSTDTSVLVWDVSTSR